MLQSMHDLIEYSARCALDAPEISDRTLIYQPGCSPAEISALATVLPGIPQSYLSIISAIRLNGVSIGYFEFSRGYGPDRSFVERLVEWNGPDVNPRFAVYRRLGVYEVASWEAEPIAVAYAGSRFAVGEMVKFSACCIEDPPVSLARDFEQLLLLAANLDQLAATQEQDRDAVRALGEFLNYVTAAGTTPERIATWENIAREVLGF